MSARILVVDDDPMVAEVVARYLERDGHTVECVGDGEEALRRALADPPDLLVLDLMLPGIDGLEVCRQLRELAGPGDHADRAGRGDRTGSSAWRPAPTTTSPSRSARASWPCGSSRCCGGPRRLARRRRRRAQGRRADWSTSAPTRCRSAATARADRPRVRPAGLPDAQPAPGVQPRASCCNQVWGWSFGDTSTVTVHVRRLREKIEPDPTAPARGSSRCGASATATSPGGAAVIPEMLLIVAVPAGLGLLVARGRAGSDAAAAGAVDRADARGGRRGDRRGDGGAAWSPSPYK